MKYYEKELDRILYAYTLRAIMLYEEEVTSKCSFKLSDIKFYKNNKLLTANIYENYKSYLESSLKKLKKRCEKAKIKLEIEPLENNDYIIRVDSSNMDRSKI